MFGRVRKPEEATLTNFSVDFLRAGMKTSGSFSLQRGKSGQIARHHRQALERLYAT